MQHLMMVLKYVRRVGLNRVPPKRLTDKSGFFIVCWSHPLYCYRSYACLIHCNVTRLLFFISMNHCRGGTNLLGIFDPCKNRFETIVVLFFFSNEILNRLTYMAPFFIVMFSPWRTAHRFSPDPYTLVALRTVTALTQGPSDPSLVPSTIRFVETISSDPSTIFSIVNLFIH